MSDLIRVGTLDKKEVSELNALLFSKMKDIVDAEEKKSYLHMGWHEVGTFIDWLEDNYNLTEKKS